MQAEAISSVHYEFDKTNGLNGDDIHCTKFKELTI